MHCPVYRRATGGNGSRLHAESCSQWEGWRWLSSNENKKREARSRPKQTGKRGNRAKQCSTTAGLKEICVKGYSNTRTTKTALLQCVTKTVSCRRLSVIVRRS